MVINKRNIVEVLLILYVCFTLIFPSMIVNKIIFAAIMGLWLVGRRKHIINIWAPLLILAVFLYGMGISVFFENDFDLAVQFLLSTMILFLIYPIRDYGIDMKKIMKIGGIVLLTVDIVYIFYAIEHYSFNLPLNLSFISGTVDALLPDFLIKTIENYGEAAIGYRGFFGKFDLMVHLGSIPFIYLPTCIFFSDFLETKRKRCLLFVFLSYIVIICSTSRALLLITMLSNVYTWWHKKKSFETKVALVGVLIVVVGIAFAYISINTDFFDVNESSNSRKLDHIVSVFSSMTVRQAIMGNGLGTYFYSNSLSKYLAHTEITLLDYFRYFGVPLALFVYYQILFPSANKKSLSKDKNTMLSFVIMIGYLIMSLTNPVLFNSVGTLIILWYWDGIMRTKEG